MSNEQRTMTRKHTFSYNNKMKITNERKIIIVCNNIYIARKQDYSKVIIMKYQYMIGYK